MYTRMPGIIFGKMDMEKDRQSLQTKATRLVNKFSEKSQTEKRLL